MTPDECHRQREAEVLGLADAAHRRAPLLDLLLRLLVRGLAVEALLCALRERRGEGLRLGRGRAEGLGRLFEGRERGRRERREEVVEAQFACACIIMSYRWRTPQCEWMYAPA